MTEFDEQHAPPSRPRPTVTGPQPPADAGERALRFAERLLALIDATRYSATYKLATLLALIDVVVEQTDPERGAPDAISARDVGRRVVELYWPQTLPYSATGAEARVLRQSRLNDIPAKLAAFRHSRALGPAATVRDAARCDPDGWDRLERSIVATVIRMPLAKLQRFGDGRATIEDRFVYDFAWPDEVPERAIEADGFDDRLRLAPGVGDHLVRLAALLRPLVQAKWIERVARCNEDVVDAHRLSEFLFGAERISLQRVRGPLLEIQGGACFYCGAAVRSGPAVDHFVPWSRHPDNALDNLVVAHGRCNGEKSASLAAVTHLAHWADRFQSETTTAGDYARLAAELGWPRRPDRSLGAARGVYLWLPEGTRLWRIGREYEALDPGAVSAALRLAG